MPKVLIAEDDLLIADMLEEALVRDGYEVCGVVSTVAEALEVAARHAPDLALLDLRLADGGRGTDLAVLLAAAARPRRIGILFFTADGDDTLQTVVAGDAYVRKPYDPGLVGRALAVVGHIAAPGDAPPPLPPPGLRLIDRRSGPHGDGTAAGA